MAAGILPDDPGAPDTTTRAGYLRALRWARGLAASFDDGVSHGHGTARAITEDIDAEITRVEREGKP